VPLSSGDNGNSPITKKVKVEEESESVWDSYVSTRMVLPAWAWVMQMIFIYISISIAHTFFENVILNVWYCQDYCDRDQHVFVYKWTKHSSRWQAV
jgi:hypothetical protein